MDFADYNNFNMIEEQIKKDQQKFEDTFKLMPSYAKFSFEEINVLIDQLLFKSLKHHNVTFERCRDWCS